MRSLRKINFPELGNKNNNILVGYLLGDNLYVYRLKYTGLF